jgi:hypothetical protein
MKEEIQMIFENNNKVNVESQQIDFSITANLQKLGIKEFILKNRDFLITWYSGRNSCIDFNPKSSSLSQNIKLIDRILKKEVKGKIDNEAVENAIRDIEDQLVKRRDEIFNLNKITKTSENESIDKDDFKQKVVNYRKQFESSNNPLIEWQNQVYEKYKNLENTINRIYPNVWSIMRFIIAVKTILNIEANKLPFLGIIIALPSGLKTTFINFFRVYIHTFYSDIFTPNSLVSHNSALTEEQLKQVDMLPKIKDKLVLIPEMAPLFTGKEDDLHKILGIIIRLVDGDGIESDSGAHGHRGYPPTMFSWIGAVVEIQPKIWKLLSTLGFKIYFFRPDLPEKSEDDLISIALDSKISEKNQQIKDALLDYLCIFDAAPIITDFTSLDENGIVKVKWNCRIENQNEKDEQHRAIKYIARIAKLLASLRGDVTIYPNKSRQFTKRDINDGDNEEQQQQISFQTEQLDFETDSVIIEDPARATIQLRNLALANAISQGRNYIKIEDVKLVVKVALSTTRVSRKKVFDLLLKEKGELTTSKIVNGLDISEPTARKTMREFQALGIANISQISGYVNSELTLVLNNKFKWFLSDEFQNLRKKDEVTTIQYSNHLQQYNTEYRRMYLPLITKTLSNSSIVQKQTHDSKSCDHCHTLKVNLPPEADIKNVADSNILKVTTKNTFEITHDKINQKSLHNVEKEILSNNFSNNFKEKSNDFDDNCNKIEKDIRQQEEEEEVTNTNNNINSKDNNNRSYQPSLNQNNVPTDSSIKSENIQKNSASLGPENFQRMTQSQEKNCHSESVKNVVNEIVEIVKIENGPISLGYALQLACQRSEIVRDYLRNEKKLTQRDSKPVRDLFLKINRHPNIKTIKRKPELVVKWIENEEIQEEMINI